MLNVSGLRRLRNQRWAGTPMNARRTLVLNRVLDGMEGKLTNAKWAAIAQCSSDTAFWDINDLVALDVIAQMQGGGVMPDIF